MGETARQNEETLENTGEKAKNWFNTASKPPVGLLSSASAEFIRNMPNAPRDLNGSRGVIICQAAGNGPDRSRTSGISPAAPLSNALLRDRHVDCAPSQWQIRGAVRPARLSCNLPACLTLGERCCRCNKKEGQSKMVVTPSFNLFLTYTSVKFWLKRVQVPVVP